MADIVREASLSGALRAGNTLRGSLSPETSLAGTVNAATMADLPAYDGEYIIEPKLHEDITLSTKNRKMKSDVTVLKIPHYEVSNEAGGTTLILGGEGYAQ